LGKITKQQGETMNNQIAFDEKVEYCVKKLFDPVQYPPEATETEKVLFMKDVTSGCPILVGIPYDATKGLPVKKIYNHTWRHFRPISNIEHTFMLLDALVSRENCETKYTLDAKKVSGELHYYVTIDSGQGMSSFSRSRNIGIAAVEALFLFLLDEEDRT
jgi:hypothetical protein